MEGGTITHSENFTGDHDSSTPFTADSSSHINFTGTTTLNISHGILSLEQKLIMQQQQEQQQNIMECLMLL